jgi:predicted ATPase/class 3 adenylate cyclase
VTIGAAQLPVVWDALAVNSLPTGTVTFLFTDVEGSTRRWQDEPESMRALLVEHDAILGAVIEKHHGHLFKHTGDGVAAVFASASDAVDAAVDAQTRLADVLPVRMGLHTGEAELRDGDYFGSTLNRCARVMGVAHGGQVVCSAATAELVRGRDDLRDLGEHRLRDLAHPEHVFQVGGGEFPALRSLENYATNLPLQASSFIGREGDIADIGGLLGEQPCVTLTGVGGVGKTRLAIEVGADVLPHYADGVWLVELAPVAHDEMVLPTIAEVLGVAAQTGEPLITTLVGRLKTKQLLVIIDNCEHLLSPVARFVDRLAAAAPGVRVLATSREPLGVAAERVRSVPPLAEGTESVELFVDRATQAGATFDDSQLTAVAAICVRLDGIPLAIELAAARARMMAPTQILERLDERFRLLTGGGRTAVERHRTLQATVAWSYDLLEDTEQLVFQRLSTLAGTFDLDAGEAIAAGGTVEDFEVLDALGHLVDKSMVVAATGAMTTRYRLLETLRQFAADRLVERPDADEVRDRHATYWCDRAVTLGRATGGTDQNAVLDAIDVDIDNYRSAFAHLLTTGRVNDAARSVLALSAYWQIRRSREGLGWFHQLLDDPDLDPRRRMRALADAANAETNVGDATVAERHAIEAVDLAETAGVDPPGVAFLALVRVAQNRMDPADFRSWSERGHRVAADSGNRYLELLLETQRGSLEGAWDTAELLELYERLQRDVLDHGDPLLIALAEGSYAAVLWRDGQIDRARHLARSALGPGRVAGSLALVSTHIWASAIDLLSGVPDSEATDLTEGLRVAHDEGQTNLLYICMNICAARAARNDALETTAVLLAGGTHQADQLGLGRGNTLGDECRARAQAAVDAHPGDLTAARRRGEAMTVDELVDVALGALA